MLNAGRIRYPGKNYCPSVKSARASPVVEIIDDFRLTNRKSPFSISLINRLAIFVALRV
jgi:hypothetical protein